MTCCLNLYNSKRLKIYIKYVSEYLTHPNSDENETKPKPNSDEDANETKPNLDEDENETKPNLKLNENETKPNLKYEYENEYDIIK